MSEKAFVIGLDCSTSGVKAVAWDPSGFAKATARIPLSLNRPHSDWYEQDPFEWWLATCHVLREICAQVGAQRIQGLAISHQRETFVPLNAQLQPLRPAILWLDQRARDDVTALCTQVDPDQFHRRTGKPLTANLAPPKIAWMAREESDLFRQTRFYFDTHAFLMFQLTGQIATSTGSADPLGLYDLSQSKWDDEILDALNVNTDQLPEVIPPGSILGTVTSQAAALSGLRKGTLVAAGIGDGQAAALGSGSSNTGYASLSLGTSVIGGAYSPSFRTSRAFRTMTASKDAYLFETVILSGTQLLDWLVRDLLSIPDVTEGFAQLEKLAANLPPGAEGLFAVPHWSGAMNPYWDANASGMLVGLRGHHRPAHIFRAILEGIAYEHRLQLAEVDATLGHPIHTLMVSGGGSISPLWLQIFADITQRQVNQIPQTETASLGAGILAALACQWYPDLASAVKAMTHSAKERFTPYPARSNIYTRLFQDSYCHLYPAIRPWIS